jgi:hypothetical protein
MNYGDYLFDNEESDKTLTEKLLLMDSALMEVHRQGNYISSNILDAYIYDDKIDPSSVELDKFDSEINENAYSQDIMELAAIGICAYNHFGEYEGYPKYFTSPDFIASLMDNVEMYLQREDIPEEIKDYYRSIFTLLDIKYMAPFLEEQKKGGKGNARVLTYSTPEGRAFANNQEQQAAFTSIIAIPAILAIVYIISMVVIIFVKTMK